MSSCMTTTSRCSIKIGKKHNEPFVATFWVARLTLQTPKLWLVGVARHGCLRFFSSYFFLFFFAGTKKKQKTKNVKKKHLLTKKKKNKIEKIKKGQHFFFFKHLLSNIFQKNRNKQKKQRPKKNEPWTLKVALRPSGVLRVTIWMKVSTRICTRGK